MHRIGWCETRKKIMTINIYISNSIKNANSQSGVVDIINSAADGHIEGMEGIEFTSGQLAGQYAHAAAKESGYTDKADIEAHLDIIESEGAKFDYSDALDHGLAIAASLK